MAAVSAVAEKVANLTMSDIEHRNKVFTELYEKFQGDLKARDHPDIVVVISVGGKELNVTVQAWQSAPGSLLRHLDAADKSQLGEIVVAKVDNKILWDLDRPLEYACKVSFVPFSSNEGRNVFWHSSAHVLGEACECHYPNCLLSHGPPVEQGFFYDMSIAGGDHTVKESDWKPLKEKATKIIKEKQPFQRLHCSLADLKKMFSYSKYKMHYIDHLLPPEGSTVYRCGTLVDLCLGPHIQNTSKIKAFDIMKNSSCYFLGDKEGDTLQRIYGVAFPDKKLLAEHKKFLEEAAQRDHRKIGIDQELFIFDEMSPGSPFILPHGVLIFNAIQSFLRSEYFKRGYQEVQSPNMFDHKLWQTSGHWQHYKDDMFTLPVEKKTFALKPMNCPGHCLIFKYRERSYRELPIRMADFGVLHRNEASGALHGMTRVRKFQQDDAHLFCTEDQIKEEIEGLFDFFKTVYGHFGFAFKLNLSTRPDKYMGDIEVWNRAETTLKDALNAFTAAEGGQWELNEGDGAFYGPKIDIEIQDALKRPFQCATIQLDFQAPINFQLEYMTADAPPKGAGKEGEKEAAKPAPAPKAEPKEPAAVGKEGEEPPEPPKPRDAGPGRARPVVLHRAIIGSFERFLAIITEHFAGRWPFWLSPRQVLIIPVMPAANDYVLEVQKQLRSNLFHADVDIGPNTMKKKILRGQQALYNFILVLGAEEEKAKSVNVRNRDDPESQKKGELIALGDVIEKMKSLRDERRIVNKL